MIHPRYIPILLAAVTAWGMFFAAFTLFIDPYGVSPVTATVERVNQYKPKRLDIDRLIKPYEVWRLQPRTVFLGTSRIHQSINPAILDGSAYAPAYNASIPASSLALNVAHLDQFVELDPKLEKVFVELFLYNFLGQVQESYRKSAESLFHDARGLFASNDALWASAVTFAYNLLIARPAYEVKPGGYLYYPPGHDATVPFSGFASGIWKLHETRTAGMRLHEPAFESYRQLIRVARQRNLEIAFVMTPNHAYDDYYIDSVDAWDTVEEWLLRLSSEQVAIFSFSQPNAWVHEPVGKDMRYWNDPYHFSLGMGDAIQRALIGRADSAAPENFMVQMTPDKVGEHVRSRRDAIRRWADENPEFVAKFAWEKRKWMAGKAAAQSSPGEP